MGQERYLIRAHEIAAMEGLAKTHFLNPNAQRVNKSLGDVTGLTGIGIHMIEVQPGFESTEPHVHYHEDEAVYILSGEAVARIGDAECTVAAGDFIGYRKGGLAHGLRAIGTEPLRVLVIGQRLAHDVADYPKMGKRIYRNEGLAWNLVDHTDISTPSAGRKT
jgi:uncharacterized cupin superfamily protein